MLEVDFGIGIGIGIAFLVLLLFFFILSIVFFLIDGFCTLEAPLPFRPSECDDVIKRAHVSRKQRATASRGH